MSNKPLLYLYYPDGRKKVVLVSTFEEIKERIDQQYHTFMLHHILRNSVYVIEDDCDFQDFIKVNDTSFIYVCENEEEAYKMFDIHTSERNRLKQLSHHADESVTAARQLNPAVESTTESNHEPIEKSFDALPIAPKNNSLNPATPSSSLAVGLLTPRKNEVDGQRKYSSYADALSIQSHDNRNHQHLYQSIRTDQPTMNPVASPANNVLFAGNISDKPVATLKTNTPGVDASSDPSHRGALEQYIHSSLRMYMFYINGESINKEQKYERVTVQRPVNVMGFEGDYVLPSSGRPIDSGAEYEKTYIDRLSKGDVMKMELDKASFLRLDIDDEAPHLKKYVKNDAVRYFDFNTLAKMGETAYQKDLVAKFADHGIFYQDSRKSPMGFPSLPNSVEHFRLLALPDLVSTFAPAFIEFKCGPKLTSYRKMYRIVTETEYEVILQGLKRADMICRAYANIVRAVIFCMTDRGAFVILFERNMFDGEHLGKMSLWNIGRDSQYLNWLWKMVTYATIPCYFFHDGNTRLLFTALRSLGYHGYDCHHRVVGRSISEVFGITLPEYKQINGVMSLAIASDIMHFCIKSLEYYRYEHEKNMSTMYATGIMKKYGISTYLLGYIDGKSADIVWFNDIVPSFSVSGTGMSPPRVMVSSWSFSEKNGAKPVISELESWFNYVPDTELEENYGLVMKPGDFTLRDIGKQRKGCSIQLFNQAVKEITEALQRLHSINLLHCDIRAVNVMFFEDHFELIDFSEAMERGKSRRTIQGSMFWNCGNNVWQKALEEGAAEFNPNSGRWTVVRDLENYEWTAEDDVQMMEVMFQWTKTKWLGEQKKVVNDN